ncbi:MAG: DUF3667 domain-containing protein [Sphingomonas bacterium]|nr:DUF3667 domain-containing protein [Sphingomonas bacterium]
MSEFDAIGDIANGAVSARAVEPATGAVAADGHSHEAACLNCATVLVGEHCHACGQRRHVHRTLSAFFHDLLHGVFHFEGKIWTTLPLLAWRPGKLTRAYIEGQRASFVSPLALFLFSVFLMFAVISSVAAPMAINAPGAKNAMAADAVRAQRAVSSLTAERARLVASGNPTATLDKRLADAREEAQIIKSIADRGFVRGAAVRMSDDVPGWLRGPLKHATDNPDLMLYKVQNNAYKYSWGLIPLSLPFMWLLFPFSRRFRLYDHMVFVTYSLSFMTLLVVVASVLGAVGWSAMAGLLMLIPPVHMYRQLKAAYGLTTLAALWRTALLVIFATVAVGMFVVILFALGIF